MSPTKSPQPAPDTIFCTSCGAPNFSGQNFCGRCGQPLTQVASNYEIAIEPIRPQKRTGIGFRQVLGLGFAILLFYFAMNMRGTSSRNQPTSSPRTPSPAAVAVAAERSASAAAKSSAQPSPDAEPTLEPTLEPTPEPPTAIPEPTPLPSVGQQVDIGDISWRVEQALEAGDRIESNNQFVRPLTTAGKFVRVRVGLFNQGTEQQSVSTGDFEIVDSEGRTYKASTDLAVSMIVGSEYACTFEQLPAGVPKLCRLIFEVPEDATGFRLKATNLALIFTEEAYINLGF